MTMMHDGGREMNSRTIVRLTMCAFLWMPVAAAAQTAVTGAIAGVAKDTSGAVLPGVTVEAASPVLIEKVSNGCYRFAGLVSHRRSRPGLYSVTFTLPGFGTFKREGIELQTGFTATVNAS